MKESLEDRIKNPEVDICFLVVGSMSDLPKVSISSALRVSEGNIFIGYVNVRDISDLPQSSRIQYVDLSLEYLNMNIASPSTTYVDFENYNFNFLVQLKWILIRRMFELTRNNFIFSDIDILWMINPSNTLQNTFLKIGYVQVLIQNFSDSLEEPNLCMGFVALRNSLETRQIILSCQQMHRDLLSRGEKVNDDDVITKYFVDLGYPPTILQLPQKTFPVGNMINLYGKKYAFLRMTQVRPYIFHANFAVGLKNKQLLMYVFMRNFGVVESNLKSIIRLKLAFQVKKQLVNYWVNYILRYFFRLLPLTLQKRLKSFKNFP